MVTIIIPTYNRSILLVHAVNSCLQQTYSDIEIIIVDDGSTDNTEQIVSGRLLNEWKNKNIKYHKQINSGAPTARNLGIKNAIGEYIQYLDSDDLLHPDKLKLQVECLKKNAELNPEACSCYGLIGESFESKYLTRIGIKCKSPNEYIEQLIGKTVLGMQTSAPLWKSSFLKSSNGWYTDLKFGQDLEYHIQLLSKSRNILFVEQELFLVRVHEGDRISVINYDSSKINSLILCKKSIYRILIETYQWDVAIQKSFIESLKTTYSNVLSVCDKMQIIDFENWLSQVISSPKKYFQFQLLINFRRIFGKQLILKFHQIIMKVR